MEAQQRRVTIVSTDYRPKRARKRKQSPAIPMRIVSAALPKPKWPPLNPPPAPPPPEAPIVPITKPAHRHRAKEDLDAVRAGPGDRRDGAPEARRRGGRVVQGTGPPCGVECPLGHPIRKRPDLSLHLGTLCNSSQAVS